MTNIRNTNAYYKVIEEVKKEYEKGKCNLWYFGDMTSELNKFLEVRHKIKGICYETIETMPPEEEWFFTWDPNNKFIDVEDKENIPKTFVDYRPPDFYGENENNGDY